MNTSKIQGTSQTNTSHLQNNCKEKSPTGSKVGSSITGVNSTHIEAASQQTLPIPAPCEPCLAQFRRTNSTDQYGCTPLIIACKVNDTREVDRLLKCPFVNVDSVTNSRATALHYAAYYDRDAAVRLLLKCKKINLNATDDASHTPLMLAAANGSHASFKLLCEDMLCDINAKDHWGRSALVIARYYSHSDIVDTLLQRPGIDIDTMTRLTVWLGSLRKLSTTLCCRKSSTQFSEENAGFMLTPFERDDSDDITCIPNTSQNR
ncbi:hypothetical protein FHW67_002657 [Herbaspirillum sp. Sphag1AN]|uniref:ankyrin repeat domain-containing protein n=1 Tax=unclassified Herbaspirillum TaxID=2624150 RepID=UPI001607E90A|nr:MULTISPECIES: ankyrin repeat domain-containing protein [unclassified Herbaspirillum]MBB3213365.1 hypothetical protein [Herbaspirillum sp. Sphag1AN]MBB3246591.1 hypothetical protein [Herbaspirillum sp. Sphag64]